MSLSQLEAENSLSLEVMGRSSRPNIWLATSLTHLYNQILSRFVCVNLLVVGALCCDNCCVSCVHYGANNKSRSKDLSGLASTSVHQLLASSCLGRPAQMSGAPSTSSLEFLKDQCVQGAVLRENFNHPHICIPILTTRHRSGTCTPRLWLSIPDDE